MRDRGPGKAQSSVCVVCYTLFNTAAGGKGGEECEGYLRQGRVKESPETGLENDPVSRMPVFVCVAVCVI